MVAGARSAWLLDAMEGPVAQAVGAQEVEDGAGGGDGGCGGEFFEGMRTEGKDEEKAGDGGEDG